MFRAGHSRQTDVDRLAKGAAELVLISSGSTTADSIAALSGRPCRPAAQHGSACGSRLPPPVHARGGCGAFRDQNQQPRELRVGPTFARHDLGLDFRRGETEVDGDEPLLS